MRRQTIRLLITCLLVVLGGAVIPAQSASAAAPGLAGKVGARASVVTMLHNQASPTWCLDQHYNSNGAPTVDVLVWNVCHGANNQWWVLTPLADQSWKIQNWQSGYCLDQHFENNNTIATHTVYAWNVCHGADNQRWWLEPYSDGSIVIVNKLSLWCLDHHHTNGNSGPTIQLYAWQCHRQPVQHWF
jgi:hypothetical protein